MKTFCKSAALIFLAATLFLLGGWQGVTYPPDGQQSRNVTVGVGGFWAPIGVSYLTSSAAVVTNQTGDITANNTHRFIEMTLPEPQVVGHISIVIGTAVAGSTIDVGLYDTNGAKVVSMGGLAATGTGNLTASVTQVYLPQGTYRFSWCANAASGITGLGYTAVNHLVTNEGPGTTTLLININGARYGTAANTCTAGVLPATMGALTAVNTITTANPPITWMEP